MAFAVTRKSDSTIPRGIVSASTSGRRGRARAGSGSGVFLARSPSDDLPADRFVNRELAWLAFNDRVLEEARDPTVPLLERLKFLAIVSANLDEFFMVRVAGLKRTVDAGVETPFPDGSTPREVLRAVSARVREQVARQQQCFVDEVRPALAAAGVRVLALEELAQDQRAFLAETFRKTILPVVTPLALDPGHPFPHLANRTICLVVALEPQQPVAFGPRAPIALIPIPSSVLPRFVKLPAPEGRHELVLLEDAVRAHLDELFHGYAVRTCCPVRVTRDWDVVFDEEGAQDLLTLIEEGIRARRQGAAVRLQYHESLPRELLELFKESLELEPEDCYPTRDMVGRADLHQLYAALDLPHLKDPPLPPQRVPALERAPLVVDAVRAGDVLLHHPYQSFDYVVRFLREAADDPNVLAIRMTLYRTGGGASPIVDALARAARNGKHVAVLMELKARFDEQANIEGARRLARAGAHVIHGLVGLKTHVKACLVARREEDGIRRYAHLSTGNYDARAARSYSDWGLFTAHEGLCEDLTELFNAITGYSQPGRLQHVALAPFSLRARIVELIRRERAHAEAGRPARIAGQLNALVDPHVIDELYRAARAGAKVELVVRGICCLRPGVPGLSENVRVVRIVDRFLEHGRAFRLENGGAPEVWLSSGDWMERNLDRRIDVLFPVLDPALCARVEEALALQLADDVKATLLGPAVRGGDEKRATRPREGGASPVRSQLRLHEAACRLASAGRVEAPPET